MMKAAMMEECFVSLQFFSIEPLIELLLGIYTPNVMHLQNNLLITPLA